MTNTLNDLLDQLSPAQMYAFINHMHQDRLPMRRGYLVKWMRANGFTVAQTNESTGGLDVAPDSRWADRSPPVVEACGHRQAMTHRALVRWMRAT